MSPRCLRSLAAAAATAAGLAVAAGPAAAADAPPGTLTECHIPGFRNGVLCGKVVRPLDPPLLLDLEVVWRRPARPAVQRLVDHLVRLVDQPEVLVSVRR